VAPSLTTDGNWIVTLNSLQGVLLPLLSPFYMIGTPLFPESPRDPYDRTPDNVLTSVGHSNPILFSSSLSPFISAGPPLFSSCMRWTPLSARPDLLPTYPFLVGNPPRTLTSWANGSQQTPVPNLAIEEAIYRNVLLTPWVLSSDGSTSILFICTTALGLVLSLAIIPGSLIDLLGKLLRGTRACFLLPGLF